MAFPQRKESLAPARITRDPEIMGGWPCVAGTRIPAMTIVWHVRAEVPEDEIFEDYPGLPFDGIDAVKAWADKNGISLEPGATDDPFSD